MNNLPRTIRSQYEKFGPNCSGIFVEISNLSDYLDVLGGQQGKWYRGHSNLRYEVVPSALRSTSPAKRRIAIDLFREFRRHAEGRMDPVQSRSENCEWMQRSQHYGLPTRLLDWTEKASVALYFACCSVAHDGLVLLIDPGSLNRMSKTGHSGPIRPEQYPEIVEPYADLGEYVKSGGLATIAIKPTFNNDRIRAQEGTFSLHGSRQFRLTRHVDPSLVYIPILRKHKAKLLADLETMGTTEMSLFPELEKICSHIQRNAGL